MKAGISGIEERKGKKKMNVLIIRFRQMGDAIIATSLCNTIRHNFPDARIDIVLNENIAPLFAGHPSIDRIISFNEAERHSFTAYLKKVAGIVKDTKYDVIIDMRSTANTMLFALLSPFSKFRIGLKKPYTRIAFNHVISFDKTEGNGYENINVQFLEVRDNEIIPVGL